LADVAEVAVALGDLLGRYGGIVDDKHVAADALPAEHAAHVAEGVVVLDRHVAADGVDVRQAAAVGQRIVVEQHQPVVDDDHREVGGVDERVVVLDDHVAHVTHAGVHARQRGDAVAVGNGDAGRVGDRLGAGEVFEGVVVEDDEVAGGFGRPAFHRLEAVVVLDADVAKVRGRAEAVEVDEAVVVGDAHVAANAVDGASTEVVEAVVGDDVDAACTNGGERREAPEAAQVRVVDHAQGVDRLEAAHADRGDVAVANLHLAANLLQAGQSDGAEVAAQDEMTGDLGGLCIDERVEVVVAVDDEGALDHHRCGRGARELRARDLGSVEHAVAVGVVAGADRLAAKGAVATSPDLVDARECGPATGAQ
jgi:hypothetical protein